MTKSNHSPSGHFHHLWHESSLKSRVLIPVLLVLTLLCSGIGFSFYHSEKTNLEQELNTRGSMLVATLSAYATTPLLENRLQALESRAQSYIQDMKMFHHVSFYDSKNHPIITLNSDSLREKITPDSLRYFKHNIFDADNSNTIGQVRLSLSTEQIEDHLAIRTFQIISISIAIIIICTTLLSWLLDVAVIKPIDKLGNKVELISHEHLGQTISSGSSDEIGHLFKTINALRVRFKRKQQDFIATLLHRKSKSKSDIETSQSKILVVDDDVVIQAHADKLLKKYNMHPFFADNGKKAIEILETTKFDLLLLDLMMPESNGFDVLEHLRSTADHTSMPVIVVSSITDKHSIVRALHMGAIDYVIKPFNNQELIARIQTHLKSSLKEREIEEIIKQRLESLESQ